MTKLLFTEDVAKLRGISRWQARRWLAKLEEERGGDVVGRLKGRRGDRLYTTEAALKEVGPAIRNDEEFLAALSELFERVGAIEKRLGAHRGT